MTKIMHTADIHLGVRFKGLGKAGDRVRSALKSAFTAMIDKAIEEKVDAMVIAGDLFDSNSVSNSLKRFALSEIQRLEDIPCVLLPGNHDCLEDGSLYLSLDADEIPQNLHLLIDTEKPYVHFEDKQLTFYGMPNLSNRSKANPVSSVERQDFEGKHILLAHGSYMIPNKTSDDDHPFGLEDIDNSGFDYVALGHWHSTFELPTTATKAAYCGSPEQLKFDQTGAGNYLMVSLDDGVAIEKREIASTKWEQIELSSANFKYTIEVERELQKYTDKNKLLKVKLTGLASSDSYISVDELYENLRDHFLYVNVVDDTTAIPEDLLKLNLPPTTILGQFISQVTESINQAEDEDEKLLLTDSLKTGFAMLSGKDVM